MKTLMIDEFYISIMMKISRISGVCCRHNHDIIITIELMGKSSDISVDRYEKVILVLFDAYDHVIVIVL